jgi:hypothetical protein
VVVLHYFSLDDWRWRRRVAFTRRRVVGAKVGGQSRTGKAHKRRRQKQKPAHFWFSLLEGQPMRARRQKLADAI